MMTASAPVLSRNDVAKLHAKFVVPIIVHEMLSGKEPFDGVAEFTLHDIIGGMKPDTALLCIALCAQHLAAECSEHPIARVLGMESNTMIHEYGALWLAHTQGQDIDDGQVIDALAHIPEDLECLCDLIGATQAELADQNGPQALLCGLLALQADAHRAAAENDLESADIEPQSRNGFAVPVNPQEVAVQSVGGNVIAFPTYPRS